MSSSSSSSSSNSHVKHNMSNNSSSCNDTFSCYSKHQSKLMLYRKMDKRCVLDVKLNMAIDKVLHANISNSLVETVQLLLKDNFIRHDDVEESLSVTREEVVHSCLYRWLTCPDFTSYEHFESDYVDLTLAWTDECHSILSSSLISLVKDYHILRYIPRKRVWRLINVMVESGHDSAATVVIDMLRHLLWLKNINVQLQLVEMMLLLFSNHETWCIEVSSLLVHTVFALTRWLHGRIPCEDINEDTSAASSSSKHEKKVVLGALEFASKYWMLYGGTVIHHSGADGIRALRMTSHHKSMHDAWVHLYPSIETLLINPPEISDHQVMLLIHQLPVDVQTKLDWILSGKIQSRTRSKSYQMWFIRRCIPDAVFDNVSCDIIRYICSTEYDRQNSGVTCQDNLGLSWNFALLLMNRLTDSTVRRDCKFALFQDWFFFNGEPLPEERNSYLKLNRLFYSSLIGAQGLGALERLTRSGDSHAAVDTRNIARELSCFIFDTTCEFSSMLTHVSEDLFNRRITVVLAHLRASNALDMNFSKLLCREAKAPTVKPSVQEISERISKESSKSVLKPSTKHRLLSAPSEHRAKRARSNESDDTESSSVLIEKVLKSSEIIQRVCSDLPGLAELYSFSSSWPTSRNVDDAKKVVHRGADKAKVWLTNIQVGQDVDIHRQLAKCTVDHFLTILHTSDDTVDPAELNGYILSLGGMLTNIESALLLDVIFGIVKNDGMHLSSLLPMNSLAGSHLFFFMAPYLLQSLSLWLRSHESNETIPGCWLAHGSDIQPSVTRITLMNRNNTIIANPIRDICKCEADSLFFQILPFVFSCCEGAFFENAAPILRKILSIADGRQMYELMKSVAVGSVAFFKDSVYAPVVVSSLLDLDSWETSCLMQLLITELTGDTELFQNLLQVLIPTLNPINHAEVLAGLLRLAQCNFSITKHLLETLMTNANDPCRDFIVSVLEVFIRRDIKVLQLLISIISASEPSYHCIDILESWAGSEVVTLRGVWLPYQHRQVEAFYSAIKLYVTNISDASTRWPHLMNIIRRFGDICEESRVNLYAGTLFEHLTKN